MFTVTSRYHMIEIATYKLPDGRDVAYVGRRFLPLEPGMLLTEHIIMQSDRLDNVTARYLGDPEQFWRICDANTAMLPEALIDENSIGQFLRIPTPLSQGGI